MTTGTTVTSTLGAAVTAGSLAVAGIQAIETTGAIGVVRSVSTTSCVGSPGSVTFGSPTFVSVALCLGSPAFVPVALCLGSLAFVPVSASLGPLAWLVFLGGRFVLVGTLVGCCRKAEQDAQPQHGPSRDQCVFH